MQGETDPKPKAGIPPALEGEVLARSGENLSSRQIAEWLETHHGVKVGHATVARFIAKRRAERADATKAVVREQLGKTATADVLRLEAIRAAVAKKVRDSKKLSPAEYAKLVELELKTIDLKLHYSGADEPDPERPVSGNLVITLPPEDGGG